MATFEIRHYCTLDGRNLFAEWRRSLKDGKACLAIDRRIGRVEAGNFGDHRFCRNGVWELRIDVGPGYRVYWHLLAEPLCCCSALAASRPRRPT